MRDFLHVMGLFLVFAFLVMQFPAGIASEKVADDGEKEPFAVFVTLAPRAYKTYLDAARTPWQVKSSARGKPSIGRMDSDIPLLMDSLPPPSRYVLATLGHSGAPIPSPDIKTYSFIPPTKGADVPAFSVYAPRTERDHPPEDASEKPTFGRDEMLFIDNSRILKEIMQ